jgi:DNA-binding PadR family transcriptional regulator
MNKQKKMFRLTGVSLLTLHLLRGVTLAGPELRQRLDEGRGECSPVSFYNLMGRLERDKLVKGGLEFQDRDGTRRRVRVYQLTEAGTRVLQEAATFYRVLFGGTAVERERYYCPNCLRVTLLEPLPLYCPYCGHKDPEKMDPPDPKEAVEQAAEQGFRDGNPVDYVTCEACKGTGQQSKTRNRSQTRRCEVCVGSGIVRV